MPSLIVGWYLGKACSFLKRMEEEWIGGKRNWKGVWEQWREGNLMSECNVSEKNYFKKATKWAMRNKPVALLKVFAPAPHSLSLGLYHELLPWLLSIMDCNLQCEINPFLPKLYMIMVFCHRKLNPNKDNPLSVLYFIYRFNLKIKLNVWWMSWYTYLQFVISHIWDQHLTNTTRGKSHQSLYYCYKQKELWFCDYRA